MGKHYDSETKAAVYGLRAKGSKQYFYVGCTKYDPSDRLKDHLYQVASGTHSNKHFSNKVNKIGLNNIVIDVLELTPHGHQWNAEKRWIDKLISDGQKLVNRIHNGVSYEMHDYTTVTEEQRQWALDYISKPVPKVNSPITKLRHVMQGYIDEHHKALAALTDHLGDINDD